ncbi:MAG TPA: hypothetical protein VG329_11215 [Candidatus Dormibacteraeota bacterium]|nr:hypothetical protein [Candidatus Dormibacteraeota bacterium]
MSTPNTGRGLLLGHFIVGAGLILFGVVMFATAGRRSRKSH